MCHLPSLAQQGVFVVCSLYLVTLYCDADFRRRRTDEMIAEESEDGSLDIDSDMQLAALALQNLSCSPASPHFPPPAPPGQGLDLSRSPRSWNDRFTFRPSPSPPAAYISMSAPMGFFGSASTDEGIEEDTMYPMDDLISSKRQKVIQEPVKTTTKYKCTWKGCRAIEEDCGDIEKHIRNSHLGPREMTEDLSDHEEEFYYEEIEHTDMDEMTANMEVMTCASPTQSCPLNLSLPRAIKQELPLSLPIPKSSSLDQDYSDSRRELQLLQQLNDTKSTPILIPGAISIPHKAQPNAAYIVPQNSPYSRQTYKTGSPLSPTTASPKHTGGVRKSRSDIKKCRKVYGMENKELWCTQCKWKKACTRFVPEVTQ